ncbi:MULTISPECIES: phosphate/phosphite/phosphonate ABC transporter substrate-binding protein [Amycolatopsis]|uniref:ABC-type phosphate/phosphonate transport system, substrate-binding protein n=2 Tax=Amycolatopsis TaxID=1813 RepID=A0A1I3K662_9PSEU|nr:phosphate/phosphite/phosphonate ABC transporter substrate-binding protein [Amycolatopsis sacchari]SFI68003.1 ABC-type phosphate/phosphonate transport system, substrate-binding protein [Amycolatopsis sacchari]
MPTLLLGAVAYDPKVVTIWAGFRAWLRDHGLPFDFVLYSNYERQAEDLASGRIHAAWNSPLAWLRVRRLAGHHVRPLVMRDTDQDLTSVVVVRADSPFEHLRDLKDHRVAVGAIDSPQATLIPVSLLRHAGLTPGENVTVRRFDVGVGLHGDHIGGERDAARALLTGEADAAAMIDANHLLFSGEGTLPAGSTRVLAHSEPYDHCVLAVHDSAPAGLADRLGELLLSMSYADPGVRPLLDLEGLTEWRPGRTTGFGPLEAAISESAFYDEDGRLTEPEYRP